MVRGEVVKVCIYLRCTVHTVKRYQEKIDELTEYVQKQSNWVLGAIYYDFDSGKSPKYAPDLQKMFDEFEQYRFDVVVIENLVEFSWDARTRMDAERQIREKGVRLVVLDRVLGRQRKAYRSDPMIIHRAVEEAELCGANITDRAQEIQSRKKLREYMNYLKRNKELLVAENEICPYKHCIHIQIGGRMLTIPLTEDNYDTIYKAMIDMQ